MDVQFILTYVYLRTFLLIATFDLLSPNIIVTRLTTPDISGSKIGYFTDFKIAHMQIETLHFVTLKYKLIRIQLRDDVNVTIYDGPGILSKSCDISKKNSTFISSSFQYITQLHSGPKRSGVLHFNIFYYTTWHNVTFGNQSHEYSINSSFYKSTVFIHKFLLNSDKNLYFNISVPYFLYKGDGMGNCIFGGITFFSVNLKGLKELRTMCVTSNAHSRNLQNIFKYKTNIGGYLRLPGIQFSTCAIKIIFHKMCIRKD